MTSRAPAAGRDDRYFLEPAWGAAAAKFLREKRRDGCSAATIDMYRYVLIGTHTTVWREAVGIERPNGITVDAVRAFEIALARDRLKPNTVVCYRRVLLIFARWYEAEYGDVGEGVINLPLGRSKRGEKHVITPEEEERLIAACRTPRDRFLIRFLLGTGLRLGEALALTLDDIVDGESGPVIVVRARLWSRARAITLGELSGPTQRYVSDVRPRTTRRDELFLTVRHDTRTGDYAPLAAQSVTVLLNRLAAVTKVRHCCARNLRHTWVMRQAAADVDPRVLRRTGGWKDSRMVERFLRRSSARPIEENAKSDD